MELSDREYLERLFEAFYEVGALPGGGVTRLGYTALEDEMHRRFGVLAEALGGTVETDLAGNSYAFLAPAEEYVLIGSHLDSVIQGGRYDGVAGVMAGLLLLKRAKEAGLKLPIKVAAFRCEESSNFGCCTMGSGLVTGQLKEGPEKLSKLTGKDGSLLGDVFASRGLSLTPPRITGVKSYLELHSCSSRAWRSTPGPRPCPCGRTPSAPPVRSCWRWKRSASGRRPGASLWPPWA